MVNETTNMVDVSRSVEQLSTQMTYVNVNVPKFDDCKDVYEFLNEFDLITGVFGTEQKLCLLAKAFKRGRAKYWFENDLQPLINKGEPWSIIRDKIIERFADTEDQERHFTRYKELTFDPTKGKRLLDFVEEIIHSYRCAHGAGSNDENCIRAVKAALPKEIRGKLAEKTDYREANSLDKFKQVIKLYDVFAEGSQTKGSDTAELKSMIRHLSAKMDIMDKDNKASREAFSAALSELRPPSPTNMQMAAVAPRNNEYQRGRTFNQERHDHEGRSYQARSSRSPVRENSYRRNNNYQRERRDSHSSREGSPGRGQHRYSRSDAMERSPKSKSVREDKAFCDEIYYKNFGKPPRPCNECNAWHWQRHCPNHLN